MPNPVHVEAHLHWITALFHALTVLTTPPQNSLAPGCKPVGATSMFDGLNTLILGSPFFLQLFNLERGRSRQILVSDLPTLIIQVLFLRLAIQKVSHS